MGGVTTPVTEKVELRYYLEDDTGEVRVHHLTPHQHALTPTPPAVPTKLLKRAPIPKVCQYRQHHHHQCPLVTNSVHFSPNLYTILSICTLSYQFAPSYQFASYPINLHTILSICTHSYQVCNLYTPKGTPSHYDINGNGLCVRLCQESV